MSKAKFTPDQQQLLRNNPYTVRVTENVLNLSKEFKDIFYKEYLSCALPRDILEKYGYPADILGKQRIWGISHMIRKQFEDAGEFRDVRTPGTPTTAASPEEKLRQLEHQVSYLTQEVEFLKKFLDQKYQEVGATIMHDSSCIFEIIHQTQLTSGSLSVQELCRIAGVSRSGYYAWVKAAPIEQDRQDFDLLLTAYKKYGYTKGAKGIYMALLHMDPPVIMNLKKIRRLMDKFNLSCPIRKANPYRRMAKALNTSNKVTKNADVYWMGNMIFSCPKIGATKISCVLDKGYNS